MGMTIDFTGKTVLITGGGRGLGKDMALLFAECGADVMVAGRCRIVPEPVISQGKSEGGSRPDKGDLPQACTVEAS